MEFGFGLVDYDSEDSTTLTESDTEYDDVEFEFGNGGGWVPKKHAKSKGNPAVNGGLPNFSTGAYDTNYWKCEQVGNGGHDRHRTRWSVHCAFCESEQGPPITSPTAPVETKPEEVPLWFDHMLDPGA